MEGVHEEGDPVLNAVEDLREEDHIGCVGTIALDVDSSEPDVLIGDFLGSALDGCNRRKAGPAAGEESGSGPHNVLVHLYIISGEVPSRYGI